MIQVNTFFQQAFLMFSSFPFFSIKWHSLSKEDQSKYYEMAKKERQVHMQLHPNWSARDNYAKHKKKRRKRDKIRDGGSTEAVFCTRCLSFLCKCLILSWDVFLNNALLKIGSDKCYDNKFAKHLGYWKLYLKGDNSFSIQISRFPFLCLFLCLQE